MRAVAEIIADIVSEASKGSYGEPHDPRTFRDRHPRDPDSGSWHNSAQRDYLYDRSMELAAACVERADV